MLRIFVIYEYHRLRNILMPPSSPEPLKSGEAATAAGQSAAFTSLCLHLENVSRDHPCPCLIHDIITQLLGSCDRVCNPIFDDLKMSWGQ